MKTTPFTSIHEALGARMAPFAGYNMPIEYTGIIPEHNNVIENVGVFDVSHMGAIYVSGERALEYLQSVCSNDISKVSVGKAQYNYMPNDKGGIVDDFILYHFDGEYMLAVNAANIEKDFAWLQQHKIDGVTLENRSERVSILAIQGPKAKATIQKLTETNLDEIPFYAYALGKFAGIDAIISNTGYTGAGGFELYFVDLQEPKKVWDALFEAGKEFGILPVGLGARDTLRLEMGYCLYGNDIDETTNPLEAGLGWVTKLIDGKPIPSRDILEKTKAEGLKRRLVGFELLDKGIARHEYEITNEAGDVIGVVTSGTMSPYLKKSIGLGYVPSEYAAEGSKIGVKVRNKVLAAQVIKLPFRK